MKKRRLRDRDFQKQSRELLRTHIGWVGYFDGACAQNPGQMGIGATLLKDNLPVDSCSKKCGHGTNNIAEYLALIALLEIIIEKQASPVLVCGDSMLVLMQITGNWKVKEPHLKPLTERAKHLASQISQINFAWIPREENQLADSLSKL